MYSIYDGTFYELTDGIAMSSPLSSCGFFHGGLQNKCIKYGPLNFNRRYVDDTLLVWTHGPDTLTTFMDLNSHHKQIQFTTELEHNNTLSFLDKQIIRKPHRTLGWKVYRKLTHTQTCTLRILATITWPRK